jgi:putative ABC transport system permease protein
VSQHSVRSLLRRPGFLLTSILTIALGVGGTTAVFSAMDTVVLEPLPFQSPGQLVRIYQSSVKNPDGRNYVTVVHYVTFRRESALLQSVAAINTYDQTGGDIGSGNDVQRIRTLQVSSDYFETLRTPPALGRAFTRDDEHGPDTDEAIGSPKIILGHALWRDRFHSDPAVVGATLVVSGVPCTVVGVMPAGFVDPVAGPGIEAWIPLDVTTGGDLSNINNHWLTLIGRVRPGVTVAQAHAELDGITERLSQPYQARHDDRTAFVPLKEDVVGQAAKALSLMLGAVGLVLLLVCVNVANLQLVRGSERAREFAVRAALGAGRARLVTQLLTESLIIAGVGGVLGLVVARVGMGALKALGSASIPRLAGMALDWRVLGFVMVISALAAILFGLAPAWHAARTDPGDALRGSGRSSTGDRSQGRLRTALVVSQVALAFVLLSSAGVLLASFRAMADTPLGVSPDSVLAFRVYLPDVRYDSMARAAFHATLDARIEALPGVKAAGAVSWLPATGTYHSWWAQAGTGPLAGQNGTGADNRVVTPDYFRALGIPLLAGREFNAGDTPGAQSRMIINKGLADRLFPGVDPVGQQVNGSTVIGVVGDVAATVEGSEPFYMYRAHSQFAGNRNWALFEVVATRGAPPASLVPALRGLLANLDPLLVLDRPSPLVDVIGRGTAQRKFTLVTLLAFAGTALGLAALGVFGVLAYAVRLRNREFGIRLALGASPGTVISGVLRQGGLVVAWGIGVGLVGSVLVSKAVGALVFHVSPLDPRVLAVAAVTLALFGTGAAYLPARRAAASDPRSVLAGD